MNTSLKTILWYTLVTAAVLILVFGCFYAEENARGLHAWQKAAREIAARGESLNWDDFIPPVVPANQNFFQAPMMTEWFVRATNGGTTPFLSISPANPDTTTNLITEFSASNYVAWSLAFEPQLDQVRDALKRPGARMDGDYARPFQQPIPNFVNYRALGLVLTHRAKCHLLLHQPELALADLTLLHHLNLTLARPGQSATLVSAMIHTAIAGLYVDTIAHGLDLHAWREPDLATLETQLAQLHLLTAVNRALQSERAGVCHLLDGASIKELGAMHSAGDLSSAIWMLAPSGWIQQNKTVVATLESQMIACVDLTNQTLSPAKARSAGSTTQRAFDRVTPYNLLAAICVPNFSKALLTASRNQTSVDQARIACALERHRLANGQFPTNLAVLLPRFLDTIPHDIVNGRPMSYMRQDEQNFLLYSVGWNEVDDGGITVRQSDGREDRETGDWVWHANDY